jgi:hypothetical protein
LGSTWQRGKEVWRCQAGFSGLKGQEGRRFRPVEKKEGTRQTLVEWVKAQN